MEQIADFLKRYKAVIIAFGGILAVAACLELSMGRSFFGADGRFGWWDGNIWSNENSQRVADAYSFSHIVHGILFFAFLRRALPKVPVRWRFLMAVLMETSWEILENSPLIINRYREATIALGYVGDSVLNSCSDILMMALGFLFAYRVPVWASIGAVILMEVGCLLWVRDNLTLNVIMLIHPIHAIKVWQAAGQPIP